jgi:hypothetical protein
VIRLQPPWSNPAISSDINSFAATAVFAADSERYAALLQRLPTIRSLRAIAAFGGNPVGPATIVLAANLPKRCACFQNPAFPLRRIWFVKPAVGVLDAYERRRIPPDSSSTTTQYAAV